jgi:hypothetical protein
MNDEQGTKMMKTTKNHVLMCAGLIMFALASCADPVRPETAEHVPEGMGLARIHISAGEPAQGVRTAVPDTTNLYFTLDFTAPSETPVHREIAGSSNITVAVTLATATWKLDVKGYTDSGHTPANLTATGSISVSVNAGTSANFYVYLTPNFSSGGTGSLKYSIGFPASARGVLGLYPIDNTPGTSREVEISSGVESTLADLAEGSYRAVIDLYDSTANTAATLTEAVHIYAGLDTHLARTFAATDFAECPTKVVDGENTLAAKLDAALVSAGTYTIVLDGGETDLTSFSPKPLSAGDKNITIILRGNGKTVQLGSSSSDNGSLFTLEANSGSSLSLELHDITLQGKSGNTASLVRVNSGGALVMKAGSLITGNTKSSSGGGVYVSGGGTFDMSGGEVRGNTATANSVNGGGVFVGASSSFTMSGGAVRGNTATVSGAVSGGGVYVIGGTFDMSGGAVSDNTARTSSSSSSFGGGVCVSGGTFTMSGGAVRGNTATALGAVSGGGVYASGTFDMSGGAVSDNAARSSSSSSSGGGVYVNASGTFAMSGGEVRGNVLSDPNNYGKEVVVVGTLTLSGEARPERVFLSTKDKCITISGPLSGPVIPIDLGITGSAPLTGYVGQPILKLDGSYSGNLAELKGSFMLGHYKMTATPWGAETPIEDYEISDGGLFVAE